MTIEEVVRNVLLDEHADVIREAVKAVAAELMELEVSELIGAERGERRPQDRATHRNGYRARRWDTRAGEIEPRIPKIRRGSYFPSILEPRRRSEQALLAVVQQAYVCGVSTRRVDQLVESLGLRISKSEVSRICRALDGSACEHSYAGPDLGRGPPDRSGLRFVAPPTRRHRPTPAALPTWTTSRRQYGDSCFSTKSALSGRQVALVPRYCVGRESNSGAENLPSSTVSTGHERSLAARGARRTLRRAWGCGGGAKTGRSGTPSPHG
jgi:hypothetical protein